MLWSVIGDNFICLNVLSVATTFIPMEFKNLVQSCFVAGTYVLFVVRYDGTT